MFEGTDSLSYKSFKTYLCKIPTVITETYINQHLEKLFLGKHRGLCNINLLGRLCFCTQCSARSARVTRGYFFSKTRVHFMTEIFSFKHNF
jgi:hypothetical protein